MGSCHEKGRATLFAARLVILVRIILVVRFQCVFTAITWATKGRLSEVDEWSSERASSRYTEYY